MQTSGLPAYPTVKHILKKGGKQTKEAIQDVVSARLFHSNKHKHMHASRCCHYTLTFALENVLIWDDISGQQRCWLGVQFFNR